MADKKKKIIDDDHFVNRFGYDEPLPKGKIVTTEAKKAKETFDRLFAEQLKKDREKAKQKK